MPLIIAIVLLLGAAAVLLALILIPAQPPIPRDRRRPMSEIPGSHLSRFSGSAIAALEGYLSTKNIRLFSRDALELAGLRVSQAEFFVLVAAGGLVSALFGMVLAGPPLALLLFLLSPTAGHMVLKFLTGKRRTKFDEQLGDTLLLLTGSLRAGHSILRAIDAAAAESANPTAEEMRRVVTETSLGKNMLTALNDIAERMQNEDFVWISQAIQINREVGGNLAEVLDQVADTIRERSEIKGQIKALAAEGKFSAYILIALPLGIIGMLMVISPGYMDPLFNHPIGWGLVALSVILMTGGGLWLRKIIDLKF